VRGRAAYSAAALGATGAMLIDLDVLIRSAADPLLYLDFHRHFSHALVFIPLGGLLAALCGLLVQRYLLRQAVVLDGGFKHWWWWGTLGCATAGLLDACTSYGTHLLWPFSQTRTAWSVISVFDPVYLFSALLFLALSLRYQSVNLRRAGLLFLCSWLLIGLVQQQRAKAMLLAQAAAAGHVVERSVVRPSIGNILVWRGVYESDGLFHIMAVRPGITAPGRVYAGGNLPVARSGEIVTDVPVQSRLMSDIRRFAVFSDHYLALFPHAVDSRQLLLGDVRFAMIPCGLRPMWGLEFDPALPATAPRFANYRTLYEQERQKFILMLRGAELNDACSVY
jgi:inner membrane protein